MRVTSKRARKPKGPAPWAPQGPRDLALMAWLRGNPWLHLTEDGRDYAPSIAARIEAATGGQPGVRRPALDRRPAHLLQLHAFGPEFTQSAGLPLALTEAEAPSGPA